MVIEILNKFYWHMAFISLDGPVSASEGEDEDETEFYDALAEGGGSTPNSTSDSRFTLNIPTNIHRRNSSDSSDETDEAQTQKVSVNSTYSNLSKSRACSFSNIVFVFCMNLSISF